MRNFGKFKIWIPALFMMLVIFTASSIPGQNIDSAGLNNERLQISGHFIFFVLLCFSYFKATKNIFYSVLLTVLYAIFDEIHQMFTPLRSSSLFDIGVDTLGALISAGILWKLQHILPKKLKNWLLK